MFVSLLSSLRSFIGRDLRTDRSCRVAILAALFATLLIGCEPPPPAVPVQTTVSYTLPKFVPVKEGTETVEKGGVVLQLAPPDFTAKREVHTTCQKVATIFVVNGQGTYQVTETPRYAVTPTKIEFVLKVTNHTDQVLKLEGTIFKLNVGGNEIALDADAYKSFTNGILTPGETKQFTIEGPDWTTLAANTTIDFAVFGMPLQLDKAGNVAERGNFDWTFTFSTEPKTQSEEVTTTEQSFTPTEAAQTCGH